ncbi:hypothetical protein AB0F18_14535 [Streptomyces sp. NPDC029216]|uniref:hypothetical protein n=1 Tax=Streptomyces sp. NPDC029216 TaxID=3154701 RepID=UPI0033E299EE
MTVLGVVASLGGGAARWLVVLAVAGMLLMEVVRRWFAFRTSALREAEHTRRVLAAVGGTESAHRAEVVGACLALAPAAGPVARLAAGPGARAGRRGGAAG